MADIFDYLRQRGDIPLSEDPFNEVDNVILAEFAYTDLSGLVSEGPVSVSLKTADEGYFRMHSRRDAEKSDFHITRAPLLMDGMLGGSRFGGMKLMKYMDVVDPNTDTQIAAVTCLLDDGSMYIAFRGTDGTLVGWREDFNMSYLPETGGQRRAVQYLNEVGAMTDRPIRLGGHSKGGNFAVYAAAFCDREVQDRIISVYTNDGPGFRDEVMEREEYRRILTKVISIVPGTSIIGMLLASSAEHIVVKSSESGMGQHDTMTWQVSHNRFEMTEPSALGRFIMDSQKDWLSKLDDRSRENFVSTLFSIFEATGMSTFGEMRGNKIRSVERMLSTVKGLPKEKQDELRSILGELIESGTRTAKNRRL